MADGHDMPADSGMLGSHHADMMKTGDMTMMARCMKAAGHDSLAMGGNMPMMDTATAVECSRMMMDSGGHDHH